MRFRFLEKGQITVGRYCPVAAQLQNMELIFAVDLADRWLECSANAIHDPWPPAIYQLGVVCGS